MITINGGVFIQEITGVQRYALEITREILAAGAHGSKIARDIQIVVPKNKYIEDLFPLSNIIQTPNISRPVWTQFILPLLSKGPMFSFGNIGPLFRRNQILCMHDANVYLTPESYNKLFGLYYRILMPLLGKTVKHLVTVSDFSRDMLQKNGVGRGREIHVIPNGHEHVFKWNPRESNIFERFNIQRNFVVIIGSKAAHKNTKTLEEIAPELDKLGVDLVIAGGSGSKFSNFSSITHKNIIRLGFVSDADLAKLYSKALCLAFPSLTEGFGLPVLEAMALACPVISANVASMPSICGNAALYADPQNPNAWLVQIGELLKRENLRAELIASGIERCKEFSWKKSAAMYLELIDR